MASDEARPSTVAVYRGAPFAADTGRAKLGAMFVIELEYTAPLSEIDAHMAEHVAWLKMHYAAGAFLVSGRKIPRDGGIIIAVGDSREQIEALVQSDPFVSHGVARARVIEFRPSQRAKDVDALIR